MFATGEKKGGKKNLIESQMHSTKGVLWTLLCTSQNEPHWILLCRSVQREAQGKNPIKFRGAHFSNWQPVLRQQRDRKKKRERESRKHPPLSDMSPMSGPCQGSLGGKRGNGFFSRARSTQRAPNDVSRYRLAEMDRQCVLLWELIQKTVKRLEGWITQFSTPVWLFKSNKSQFGLTSCY